MTNTLLYELFGGIGGVSAFCLGISACIWKYIQNYEFKFDYYRDIETPINVLPLNWENSDKEYPDPESFGKNYNRKIFGIQNNNQWNININKNHGDVYIYKNIEIPPFYPYNEEFHYLRINIKNIKPNNTIKFQQKFFKKNWEFAKNNYIKKDIIMNGENIFETKSLLHNNNENVEIEQIGIYISGNPTEINNIIIDEVYYGDKWKFWNISFFGFCKKTILYRKKKYPTQT